MDSWPDYRPRIHPMSGAWIGFPFVALTIGIVGLPNAGKSTLFNALTKNDVLAANYPFATIEPNVGVVGVPDDRLPRLAELFASERDRKSTRLNSSHVEISYAVFCLKKKI